MSAPGMTAEELRAEINRLNGLADQARRHALECAECDQILRVEAWAAELSERAKSHRAELTALTTESTDA